MSGFAGVLSVDQMQVVMFVGEFPCRSQHNGKRKGQIKSIEVVVKDMYDLGVWASMLDEARDLIPSPRLLTP